MELIKDYMRDDAKRHMLNDLTKKTFGFTFESWVTNGYFEGDYIPYSFVEDGKLISNVSANIMNFNQNGRAVSYIQIGTVMTDKEYRNQGLARRLIEQVIEEYKDKCDGIYLFGNLSAVGFYNKTGFKESVQYSYSLKKDELLKLKEQSQSKSQDERFVKVDQADLSIKEKYMDYVRNSAVNSALEQSNKFGLQMFYTANMKNVYYSKDLDCFIVLCKSGDAIELTSVIAREQIPLDKVISQIKLDYKELKLGFAPSRDAMEMFDISEFDGEEDYRFFIMGDGLESIVAEKLYFPEYSHA